MSTEIDDDVLVIDESDRYGRLRLIPWWRQERLRSARLLVVGAGALGNEVLKNLALLGIGHVTIIDRDDVETSNLSRSVLFRAEDGGQPKAEVAARRLREINPDVQTRAVKGDVLNDLGLGTFASMDVIIGCLDNREARLWVNRQCWKVGIPWVDSGIQEIQGVVKVFVPPDSPCYECAMTARDYQLLNLRYSCPLLPREAILEGKVPTAPTIASMMGALQVQEALKLLHGLPASAGEALVFNGVTNQFYSTKLPRKPDCLSHEHYPEPTGLDLGHQSTLQALFDAVEPRQPGPLSLALDRDLVTGIHCPACGTTRAVMRPSSMVKASEATCAQCGAMGRPEFVHQVDQGGGHDRQTLAELGIPGYDILRVESPAGVGFYRLDADRAAALGD